MAKNKSSYLTVLEVHTNNPKRDSVFHSEIELLLQSRAELIILVEGISDKKLMDKFYQNYYNSTYVLFPPDVTGESAGGWTNVQKTVSTIDRQTLIGIIDVDFKNIDKEFTLPAKIFFTDAHDMEMMILQSAKVISSIKAEFDFEVNLDTIIEKLKYITMLRFYQYRTKLKINFNRIHDIDKNSKLTLDELVAKFKDVPININEVAELESEVKSNFFQMYNGHDVSKIIAINITKEDQKNSISYETLERVMRCAYQISDFEKTKLAKQITSYCSIHNINLKESN